MHSRVALTIAYSPQATYSNQNDIDICAKISHFHRHSKLSQHIDISMKLIPKPTILPIFHFRYRSGWPLGSLLCHVDPNLRQKSLLYAIWAILGFSPHSVPWSIYIHFFSCFPILISTYRWNDMHSRVALTISYLPQASYLFKSKWYWHIRRKYRIFTAMENYLNT